MSDQVADQLYAWLSEAVELRFGPGADPAGKLEMPTLTDGPSAFSSTLIRARQRADRIEELMHKAKRVRVRLANAVRDAAEVAEDKFDEALINGQSKRAEFSTGIERKAEANLGSIAEKRAQRLAQHRLDTANEVVDALKDMHFGIGGFRTDLRDIMRSFQLESNLER